jgi:serine/threonine-protein kinase SRK2
MTIREIRNHPWFLKNLPRELTEAAQAKYYKKDNSAPIYSDQTVEEIMKIIKEARTPPKSSAPDSDGRRKKSKKMARNLTMRKMMGRMRNMMAKTNKQVKAVHASGDFQHLIK